VAYGHAVLARDPGELTTLVLDRVNHSSALRTQFEYLCDMFVLDGDRVLHFEDLSEDYAIERFGDHCLTLQLRWGRRDHRDLFALKRDPRPERAHESVFIHPVVRAWSGRSLVAEQYLLEDLHGQWRDPVRHPDLLLAFLRAELKR
jgi:hypothetical protein